MKLYPLHHPKQWEPVDAPLRNSGGFRSAENYTMTVQQFFLASSPRYQPVIDRKTGRVVSTYCNILVWDVTMALGCEIPHWIGEGKARREQDVNTTLEWLEIFGWPVAKWFEMKRTDVLDHVNAGKPAVALWKNPAGHGHIAMVIPSTDGKIRIAQAGAKILFDVPLEQGFGDKPVRFFAHE